MFRVPSDVSPEASQIVFFRICDGVLSGTSLDVIFEGIFNNLLEFVEGLT